MKQTKIKSCKSDDFSPNVFFHEEKEYEDPVEIGNVFNTFFTSLSSTSLSSESECNNYIDKTNKKELRYLQETLSSRNLKKIFRYI